MLEAEITRRWAKEAPIYAAGFVLFTICIALLASQGIFPEFSPIWVNARLFLLSIVAIASCDAGWQLIKHRPAEPTAYLKARYTSPNTKHAVIAGLPLLLICITLLPFFSKMKAAIPLFNAYTWDDTFIAWDHAIFAGNDAWEVLQPALGVPIITAFLALLYQLWFLLLYPGCLYFAFARLDSTLRRRFFLSYVLSWTLIGGAMATWLASVGPVFVGPMLGDNRFDDQMAYLNAANEQVPIMTLKVQEMLLDWYNADANGLGSGITAMPSMHCAIAFLFWLAMRQISRGAGIAFGAFFVITWLSSVHLAYHYAVDGLVSLMAVSALWWASKPILGAWDAWLERNAQPALRTNTVPAE